MCAGKGDMARWWSGQGAYDAQERMTGIASTRERGGDSLVSGDAGREVLVEERVMWEWGRACGEYRDQIHDA